MICAKTCITTVKFTVTVRFSAPFRKPFRRPKVSIKNQGKEKYFPSLRSKVFQIEESKPTRPVIRSSSGVYLSWVRSNKKVFKKLFECILVWIRVLNMCDQRRLRKLSILIRNYFMCFVFFYFCFY